MTDETIPTPNPMPPAAEPPAPPPDPMYVVMNVYPPQRTWDSATQTTKTARARVGVQLHVPDAAGKSLVPSGQGHQYFEVDDDSAYPCGRKLTKAEVLAAQLG